MRARELFHEGSHFQFDHDEIPLGALTSYSLTNDPRHLAFVLARYKFCAKMLDGKAAVMEVGCGDGFGLPLIAQAVGHVYAVDWDERLVESINRRLGPYIDNMTAIHLDLNEKAPDFHVDAAFSIDVIEHLDPEQEKAFLDNVVNCLPSNGVLITGTPNLAAAHLASERSAVQHINLKSMDSLRELMGRYFENVFMFGMNDEVLHTGYGPMCHYIWSVAAGRKT